MEDQTKPRIDTDGCSGCGLCIDVCPSDVGGSYEAPALLGRAEIDRGRVYSQGTTYVIRRGTVDFTNPQAIDPAFNLEAEAGVRSYRVTLKMNGTLERVFPTLTSDPPLSAVQILNLLAGADESAVASLQASQLDTSRLAATGAATLAAGACPRKWASSAARKSSWGSTASRSIPPCCAAASRIPRPASRSASACAIFRCSEHSITLEALFDRADMPFMDVVFRTG